MLYFFLLLLQLPQAVDDWSPDNTIGIESELRDIERLCEQHAKTEILLQYDEPGYLDFNLLGCSYGCQSRLLNGQYEYFEIEVPASEKRKPSAQALERRLIDGPGKYRFSVERRGHSACKQFEALRERNRPRLRRLLKDNEDSCIASQKVANFKSRFGVKRHRYNNRALVSDKQNRFNAQKAEVQIIRLSTGEVEARRSTLRLTLVPDEDFGTTGLGAISCGGTLGASNFIDHVLKGEELSIGRENFNAVMVF